jgi:serine/threonine protein phosphatase PrpC
MMLNAFGATHPGRVRPVNEDSFLCDPESGLFMVADGMGGHHAGEIASSLAVEAVRTFLERTRTGADVTWPYGIDPALSFDANRLMTAIKLANRRVFKTGESRDEYTGMGTTLVVGLVSDGGLLYASVGDSRIYSFDAHTLTPLTEDDSWVRMILGENADRSIVAAHPMRHVLTSVIGARDRLECKVMNRKLERTETFLFCSDGLHGAVEGAEIARTLAAASTPEQQAQGLIDAALANGGADNITALVVRYEP